MSTPHRVFLLVSGLQLCLAAPAYAEGPAPATQGTAEEATELATGQATPEQNANPTVTPQPERSPLEPLFTPGLRLGGRVHAAYLVGDREPVHQFDLVRARFSLDLEVTPWLTGEIDINIGLSGNLSLKDVNVEASIAKWLKIAAGYFKKPFSRLYLIGPGDLPIFRRGIVNDWLTKGYNLGGRDVGIRARGKLGDFRYALGLFNGAGSFNELDAGKDIAAWVTYDVLDELRIGASGSFRYLSNTDTLTRPRNDIWGAGLDLRLELDPVEWVLEVLWGMDDSRPDGPQSLGGTTWVTAQFALNDWVKLAPVVKLELLDVGLRGNNNLAFSALAGANVHLGDYLRILVQGEGVWTEANVDPLSIQQELVVAVYLALDYKQWIWRTAK